MSTDSPPAREWSLGVVAGVAMLVGLAVVGYGALIASVSALGAAHIGAIGFSLFLAGLFATQWAGDRFGVSDGTRRRLSLAFAALAVLLFVAFVVLNYASFEATGTESGAVPAFLLAAAA